MILSNAKYQLVGHVSPAANWHTPPHKHGFHELILVVRGKLYVTSEGRRVSAAPGEAVIYPAGVSHAERTDADDPLDSLFLSIVADHLPYSSVTKGSDRRGHILHALRWLYAERDSHDPVWKEQRHAIAQSALAEFMRPPDPEDGGMLMHMRAYMRSRMAENITLAELATQAGMSKFHFLRTYRRFAQRTPMADLRAMRADYARELLVSTATPIKEIAAITGLGSPCALSRVFSFYYGMPPGHFRK